MGSHKYYRRYIEKIIAANPSEITIARDIIQETEYRGKVRDTLILAPQTVRLYNKRSKRQVILESGRIITTNTEMLLTGANADIKEKDIFSIGNRKYRVTFVKDYLGICKQAELEVIEDA